MEENQTYAIPANYTDSGRLFGGTVAPRNAVETLIITVLLGYVELFLIPMPIIAKVIVCVITIVPLDMVAIMGIDGDSLFQYVWNVIMFVKRKQKLHFRRPDDE